MTNKPELSHCKSDMPMMVDVSAKSCTGREARAQALVKLPLWVCEQFSSGDLILKKGPVFATAIIAGTMAAKNTASLIPFCHPLRIDGITITIGFSEPGTVRIDTVVKSFDRTGVEMEALVAASIASLTIFDMCKSLTKDIEIIKTCITEKSGGKHGHYQRRESGT